MWIYVTITAVAVAATLAAAKLEKPALSGVAKLIASCGFLAIALLGKAYDSSYGLAILIGLVFSWWGDACLISKRKPFFLSGLVSFLAAHVAYIVAFHLHGTNLLYLLYATGPAVLMALGVLYWLRPHVDSGMRVPVYLYVLAISAMVVMAIGALGAGGIWLIPAGALAFYISDLAVARERFVKSTLINRAWGLPLYYAGQILLAFSVTTATPPAAP